ncbi:hypothetical protein GRI33_14330 [Brucella sp. BO3]|uniref:hypothetical protein n=1 Tax=unclassified Brucella TaxID=2632610 RepID=UPI00084FB265|nr:MULTISPECIES: hypothetical protein [unclassified Brucella]OEI83517.1 hypothetical protein BA060_10805 [Brucella sp. B13-0095]QMV28109.1 hypothetical protein GRI33_14330 [Brucella sp. BO3]SCD24884.1 hypothetical protein BR141012304_20411 [Brucella inopinata]
MMRISDLSLQPIRNALLRDGGSLPLDIFIYDRVPTTDADGTDEIVLRFDVSRCRELYAAT